VDASWTTRAFGLTVHGNFPAPGFEGRRDPSGTREVTVSLVAADRLEGWRPGAEVVCERRTAAGEPLMLIEREASGDYRIHAPDYGTFRVARDGREILVAPDHPSPWRWQRYLVGQALPLAAILQGVEVLHASAVAIDGLAVGLAGASYSGKTTIAMALVEQGARLLCDDVLAVEPDGAGLLAHPGPAIVNLRHGAAASLAAADGASTELGRDDEAIRLHLDAGANATPLAALYVLHRGGGESRPVWEKPTDGEATLLLASSFNFIVLAADRLRRQLDVCARLAQSADVAVLRLPSDASPALVARAVIERLRESVRCAA
jgi:hypothetical protein